MTLDKFSPEDMGALMAVPLFSNLPLDSLGRIVDRAAPRNFDDGHILFETGEAAEYFYVVLDGWVKLYRQQMSGKEVVINVFTRAECFAEAAMFMNDGYPASAEVIGHARLLAIHKDGVHREIRANPDAACAMIASISFRLKMAVGQIEHMKGLTGVQRVANFILSLSSSHIGQDVIQLPYNKALIAGRLGMTPETFSRALAELRRIGVMTDENHRLVVSDVEALSNFMN